MLDETTFYNFVEAEEDLISMQAEVPGFEELPDEVPEGDLEHAIEDGPKNDIMKCFQAARKRFDRRGNRSVFDKKL